MRYYQTKDGLLVQFNPETKIARIKNNVGLENSIIPLDIFNSTEKEEIKKQKFYMLLNVYFKNVQDKWTFENTKYKKLPNFEVDKRGHCTNYDLKDIPEHDCEYHGTLIFVYHHGRVYYFKWSYNGENKGYLVDTKTFETIQWCKPQHCAPIQNVNTKRVV